MGWGTFAEWIATSNEEKRKHSFELRYWQIEQWSLLLALTGGIHTTRLPILQNVHLYKVMSLEFEVPLPIWHVSFQVSEDQVVTANRVLEQGQYLGFIISGMAGMVRWSDQIYWEVVEPLSWWGPHSIEWWSTCEPNHGGCVREGSRNRDFCEPNTILNRRLAKYHRPLRTFEARLWTRWQGGLARRHRGLSRIAAGRRFDWRPVGDESKPKHGRKKQGKTDSRERKSFGVLSWFL